MDPYAGPMGAALDEARAALATGDVPVGAVVLSRLDRLVFGAFDAKAGAVGSLWDVVRDRRLNHRPEVVSGVLAAECSALLDDFFAHQRLG